MREIRRLDLIYLNMYGSTATPKLDRILPYLIAGMIGAVIGALTWSALVAGQ